MMKRLLLSLAVAGMCLSAGTVVSTTTAHAAPSCSSLKSSYKVRVRPRFLRTVRRHQTVANYFRSELRRAQSGSTPKRSEINRAYAKTKRACRNSRCRRGAKAVLNATLNLYRFNRRWKRAGCPGVLTS